MTRDVSINMMRCGEMQGFRTRTDRRNQIGESGVKLAT